MKKVTITSEDITPKQWSNFILELNLIKKAWKPYATLNLHCLLYTSPSPRDRG